MKAAPQARRFFCAFVLDEQFVLPWKLRPALGGLQRHQPFAHP